MIDNSFDFPTDLRSLSNTEREALGRRHAAFNAVNDTDHPSAELSPSRVMDAAEVSGIRRERAARRGRMRPPLPVGGTAVTDRETGAVVGQFVEGVGYVMESDSSLYGGGVRTVSKEEAEDLKNIAIVEEAVRLDRERYARMSDAEREAEDRFGDIDCSAGFGKE